MICLLLRLQEWAAKAAEREKAKAERRRERRERMKAGAARHRFDDPQYEQQKASIAENLEDALEEGTICCRYGFIGFILRQRLRCPSLISSDNAGTQDGCRGAVVKTRSLYFSLSSSD